MVEYLLMVVISVAFVMALSRSVGKPLQNYIQNNVIDLVGCMLRVGQFPTQSFGLCQGVINARLNFNDNIPGSASTANEDSTGSDSSEENSNNGDSSTNNNSSRASSTSSSFRPSNSTGSIDDEGSGNEESDTKTVKVNSDTDGDGEIAGGGFTTTNGQTIIIRKIRRNGGIGGSFLISGKKDKDDDGQNFVAETKQSVPTALLTQRTQENSFAIPKPKRGPQGGAPETEMEFSFLGMVKWVIIIAILIILGFFTFSQLNSIRKGWTE